MSKAFGGVVSSVAQKPNMAMPGIALSTTLMLGTANEAYVRVIDAPPSTNEAVPVTKDESSDAR
ncbi:hypothetical protein SAMN05444165_7315 [Paraburkholderia phenazinium]|uniref:Uncharacterized protein n=1 Tax=Paraburkholderia phenazinium TaxID=60549 RepID=A0A1N6LH84_9BURK|nr:hypothetical protein SAMN05444165_7315 [Paraburkholderia phenazinium]